MRRFVFVFVCFIALLVPVAVLAGTGEHGFNGVVHSLEIKYHVRATRIPFMGLISFVSRRATQGGVGGPHVAEFDDFHESMDGSELNRMVQEKLGEGWERVVRETSRDGQEQTLVFMRPEGNRMGLFVVDADGHELDVVQMSVDPAHLNEKLNGYGHHPHNEDGDTSD